MHASLSQARIELLQSMAIFGSIRADTLEFLLGVSRIRELKDAEYFFHEGDAADSAFVLESGRVQMLKSWEGRQYELQILESGNSFGEVALIDLEPRTSTVRALDVCSAIELSADSLFRLYQRDQKQFTLIQMNMAREVCRRLRHAYQRLFEIHVANAG